MFLSESTKLKWRLARENLCVRLYIPRIIYTILKIRSFRERGTREDGGHAVAACVRSARATPPNWLFAMRSVLVVRWAFLHVGTTTFKNIILEVVYFQLAKHFIAKLLKKLLNSS